MSAAGSNPAPSADAPVSLYPVAPAFAARVVGSGLVVLAVLVFGYAAAAYAWGWPLDVLIAIVVLGLAGVIGGAAWLRSRAFVVRLDDVGYRVRMVRGVGVAEGRWLDVEEAAAATPHDVRCLVLRRTDGTTTSIPVDLVAAERDAFADDVRARLSAAHRKR